MQVTFLCTGKTDGAWLKEGIRHYEQRLRHYVPFELIEVGLQKKWMGLPSGQQMQKEAALLLPYFAKSDFVVLLDERGKTFRSAGFAGFLQQQMNRSVRHLLFVAGGPWGLSDKLAEAAHMKLSLSSMTFSHQMVRLFFVEQLYRAMTILRNESYHHE